MNGFITRAPAGLCLAAVMTVGAGCCRYKELVDPCWPERYNFAARRELCAAIAPQVKNGHVLDQTLFNYHFECGTCELNRMGQEKLIYLMRRRPAPDPTIYLATAQDLGYDPGCPEKFAEQRTELDSLRIVAIQKYLTAQTAGRHMGFRVLVHDPAEVGWDAISVDNAVQGLHGSFSGALPTGGGGGGGSSITLTSGGGQ